MDFPDWIDAELIRRCRKPWDAGDYENAVFSAFKVLETRGAAISGRAPDLHGVKVFDVLLSPDTGSLKVSPSKSEQEGVHQTFRGLYLWLRNPSGHKFVHFGRVQAFALLCFVDFLLSFLRETHRAEIPVEIVDSPVGRYLLADVDNDGTQEKIIVTEREHEGRKQSQLLVLDPIGTSLKEFVLLKDFADFAISTLEARDVNSDGVLEIIISALVGAHSESMFIFRWDGSSYSRVGEFLSDAPNIEVKDLDGDGIAEVIVKGRDYESDPITNSVFKVYHWVGNEYQLVQEKKTRSSGWDVV